MLLPLYQLGANRLAHTKLIGKIVAHFVNNTKRFDRGTTPKIKPLYSKINYSIRILALIFRTFSL